MGNLRVRLQERRARDAELPFWKRGMYLPLALLVVAGFVVGAIYLALSPGEGQESALETTPEPPAATSEEPAPSASVTAEPETTTTAPAPVESEEQGAGCDTPSSGSGEDALSTAPEVQWSPVGSAPTATSADDGPLIVEGPKRCYAQTAAGALLAAHNFMADVNDGRIPQEEIIETRVSPEGPIYGTLIAAANEAGGYGTTNVNVMGYRFLDSTPGEEYTLSIIYGSSGGAQDAMPVEARLTVRWLSGDWMIWDAPSVEPIAEVPASFTSWGPLNDAEE